LFIANQQGAHGNPVSCRGIRSDRSAVAQPDGPSANEDNPASSAVTDSFFAGLAGE
jgi:hypothetical protein